MTVVPGMWSGTLVLHKHDGLVHVVHYNGGIRVRMQCGPQFQFKVLKKGNYEMPTCMACFVAKTKGGYL